MPFPKEITINRKKGWWLIAKDEKHLPPFFHKEFKLIAETDKEDELRKMVIALTKYQYQPGCLLIHGMYDLGLTCNYETGEFKLYFKATPHEGYPWLLRGVLLAHRQKVSS